MTLKELFKKYNAQPGFKFKHSSEPYVYEVLYIGNKKVFVKDLGDGEESSFNLDMEGYEKYEEPKKTKKIMVAEYYHGGTVFTLTRDVLRKYPPNTKKVESSEREIEIECDE